MRKEAEQEFSNLCQNFDGVFSSLRILKKGRRDLEGGRCLSGREG